jgi:hypothetical protein
MMHKCSIQGHGDTSPAVTEIVFSSTLSGAIAWTRIQAGFYRGTHSSFVTGNVLVIATVRPFAASTEVFIDVVDTNEPLTNAIDVSVLDAEGNPCDEFFGRLDITIAE